MHTLRWLALDRMPQHPVRVPKGRDRRGFDFWGAYNQHIVFPDNAPEHQQAASVDMYRHDRAIILAVDDMLGRLFDCLDRKGLTYNTIVLFTSDHGTQAGSQGINPWLEKNPYDGSLLIPGIVWFPARIAAGNNCEGLFSMVDCFPTLCGLAESPMQRGGEGQDLSQVVLGQRQGSAESAFIVNFSKWFDWLQDDAEWGGIRMRQYTYVRWLNGKIELYDRAEEPRQMRDLVGRGSHTEVALAETLAEHQRSRGDELVACRAWQDGLDDQRRVVRIAFGKLSHSESEPDWPLRLWRSTDVENISTHIVP